MLGYLPYPSVLIKPSNICHGNLINKHDAGLKGASGADAVVELLRANGLVERLALGHNELEDDGCVLLFEYLSEAGRKHQVSEISLNANKIGDAGLLAIARYLEENQTLGALFLQNNLFQGDRRIMLRFTLAVNGSNLHTLCFACNPSLSEAISSTFLPNLSSDRLSELTLSLCSLGPTATPSLVSYLTSPRSYGLHVLKLNGNPLGLTSVARIVNTLERANWSIAWLEMYACSRDDPPDDGIWNALGAQLQVKVFERNHFLRRKVEEEALGLLPCARALLLNPAHSSPTRGTRLPMELLLHILSFLAPSLSTAQRLRVFAYAASIDTLPSVNLVVPHVRNASSLSRFAPKHTCVVDERGFPVSTSDECAACLCKKSTPCRLMGRGWKSWLNCVGCDRFEAPADPVELEQFRTGENSR